MLYTAERYQTGPTSLACTNQCHHHFITPSTHLPTFNQNSIFIIIRLDTIQRRNAAAAAVTFRWKCDFLELELEFEPSVKRDEKISTINRQYTIVYYHIHTHTFMYVHGFALNCVTFSLYWAALLVLSNIILFVMWLPAQLTSRQNGKTFKRQAVWIVHPFKEGNQELAGVK